MLGVAFKKTFSYAGFEMQPKKYKNPKIALLNVELELKAEKANAEVRVDSVEVGHILSSSLNLALYSSHLVTICYHDNSNAILWYRELEFSCKQNDH